MVLTSSSTSGCIVAENRNLHSLCSVLCCLRMVSIYSKKPISNILSASSMTMNSKKSKGCCWHNSASFKGVDINISVDWTSCLNYSSFLGNKLFLRNLTLGAVWDPMALNMRNSLYSCMVNSLVGDTTTAFKPSPCLSRWSIGAMKARDLPLPVSANTIADLLCTNTGIVCI